MTDNGGNQHRNTALEIIAFRLGDQQFCIKTKDHVVMAMLSRRAPRLCSSKRNLRMKPAALGKLHDRSRGQVLREQLSFIMNAFGRYACEAGANIRKAARFRRVIEQSLLPEVAPQIEGVAHMVR